MLKATTTDWKERVRPILQVFVDWLPGALLEEKEFSQAWHYRRADAEQASRRARGLLGALAGFTRNIDVQVLEGNTVLEVRNTGVSKGTAAVEWLGRWGRSLCWRSVVTGPTRTCFGRCPQRPTRYGWGWRRPPPGII
jgi:trehalose 6-phosphate synthase/phosphatase